MKGAGAHQRVLIGAAILCVAAGAIAGGALPQGATSPVVWTLDNLSQIGGHSVTVVGTPRVVDTPKGPALEFNGRSDGLFIEANPLRGLERFTIDVLFEPAPDGPEEQRFLHVEENGSGNRALIELRRSSDARWTLDTFLRHGAASLTLLDRARSHPPSRWHTVSLAFDGTTMTHHVDRVPEARGAVAFRPLGEGRTSIGVRQNRVSWFKGRIREIRFTPAVVIPLWPEGVPGGRPGAPDERLEEGRVYNVHHPTLTYVAPARGRSTGTAVIVCPGGSYARLAMANEADGAALTLSALGVSSFILKYRLAEYGYPAPLQDVLRAIRFVRTHAADFGIRPDRIGVFGASAGGHLAAMSATLYDDPEGRTGAVLDATPARPDFAALLYPVVSMDGPAAHAASRQNLLGKRASPALARQLSLENRVTKDTPPMFLVHTAEDRSVPLENSIALFQALRAAGVPSELHVYDKGPHGFGFTRDLGPTSEWPRRLEEWMRAHGWLP
jgi:acetyl esterase/lipase